MTEGSLEVKLPTTWTDEQQRWEESEKRRKEERASLRRKKIQVREKVGKSQNTALWFVVPESRKVGSLKRRVPSQLVRWEIKKLHAVVARSTFRSQNVQSTSASEPFRKLRCWKSARRCGAKHISKSKCTKHTRFGPLLEVEMSKKCMPLWHEAISKSKCTKDTSSGPLLEVEMSKKCTPLWREAHFKVNMHKTHQLGPIFWRADVVSRGTHKGLCKVSKVSRTLISKNDGRRGTFEEDLQRCIFRGRRSTRDMFIRAVRGSGRWFPQRGCILEHQIFSFGKMILRDRCSTSYDLASLFRGWRSSLDRWSGQIAKRSGTRPSALHSKFHFWRFLMLSSSKIDEVSQNICR